MAHLRNRFQFHGRALCISNVEVGRGVIFAPRNRQALTIQHDSGCELGLVALDQFKVLRVVLCLAQGERTLERRPQKLTDRAERGSQTTHAFEGMTPVISA